jgi:uncharacterized protein YjbI with pentapeptide repeats
VKLRTRLSSTALVVLGLALVMPEALHADVRACGDVAAPAGVQVSDALIVLRRAVGINVDMECSCNAPLYDLAGRDFTAILSADRSDYIDLSHADLTGADFHGLGTNQANFNGAVLRDANMADTTWGIVNFNGADLRGADLRGAKFSNRIRFLGADLRDADLRGASFTSTIFLGARLEGARLDGVVWGVNVICPDGSAGPCH